ncbi:hypothetical protein, partial [Phascolarctobacterium succinatutens]|uniref:hypothetical protein n=1 Tax=Phascolarctobacterium succinatutens TaxID=626940 RepID=UPI0030791DDD
IKNHDALVNGDKGTVSLNKDAITDGGLVDNNSKTNNKGDYKWNVGENGIVADGVTNFAKNYDIQVTAGNSKVNSKKIYLNNINASTTYGSKEGLKADGDVSLKENSIVYGDQVSLKDGASVSYKADGEYAANKGDRDTADAGTYEKSVVVTGAELVGNELGNYELVNNATGVITVKKATLNVGLNDVVRTYGNATITSGSYSAGNITGLVNGDNYGASDFKVTVNSDGAIAGVTGNRVTNDHGDYTWSGTVEVANAGLNKNYDLLVNGKANSYVGKAQLSVSLNDVVRTYGDTSFTDGTSYGIKNHDALVNGDEGTVSIKEGAITDGGLVDNNNKTNNKGDYKWTAGENGIVAENVANFAKNYDIKVTAGNSKVNPKKIYLNNINASTTYGSKEGLKADGNVSLQDNSIVYGDQVSLKDGASVSYKADGEYAANKGGRDTADVGEYRGNVAVTGAELAGNELGNYELVNEATGDITVTPAKLTFVVDDKTITQGVPAKYTGKANGLTNGDILAGIGVGGYELDSSVNPLIVGVYEDKIGVLINGSLHLTGGDGLLKNYKVEIDPGTLTVLASFNPADDYWFGTAPWDKERNLRERKAEFHYVAGGMSL